MSPRIVALLQARMGSARLPGKSLATIQGQPMLGQLLARLEGARRISQLVVATTMREEDDPICALASQYHVACFRGAEHDVLDRFYQAARSYQAELVVRLTGDNPLVDAAFVDWTIERWLEREPRPDYANTFSSATFPVGLSAEVFTMEALATAWREDRDMGQREHVTPHLEQHPERFRIAHLGSETNDGDLRLTVDTPEDFARITAIFEGLDLAHRKLSTQQIVAWLRTQPSVLTAGS